MGSVVGTIAGIQKETRNLWVLAMNAAEVVSPYFSSYFIRYFGNTGFTERFQVIRLVWNWVK